MPTSLRRSLAALVAVLLILAPWASAPAKPLPPGALLGRPCEGRAALDLPLERSVDAFTEALYDIDAGSESGALSTWLALHYEDDTTLWVRLGDIGDEELDAQGLIRQAIDGARVCAGGRVFPQRLGPSTSPRLWTTKREVLRLMEAYNARFIADQVLPAAFLLFSTGAAIGGMLPSVVHRAVPVGALLGGRNWQAQSSLPGGPSGAIARPGTMMGGQAFDKAQRFGYPYRELLIEQPGGGRARLDAYDPRGVGEIISRKFTQLAEVEEKTALGYVQELATKYRRGYLIAKVPSSGPLAGQQLRGRQILEVPIQMRPIPKAVLDLANQLNIVVRDATGKTYP